MPFSRNPILIQHANTQMKSYSSMSIGLSDRLRELRALYNFHTHDVSTQVDNVIAKMRLIERRIEDKLEGSLTNRKILEIGPGQKLVQMRYFSSRADIVGIDLDVIPNGFDPVSYWRMITGNGFLRFVKTVGRKFLGIDRRFNREYMRQLGVSVDPELPVLQQDAARTGFQNSSFDCVISFSVFEHLQDPDAVIKEIARLLRPAGVAYISTHIYTSDTGCHDPRLFFGHRGSLPYWSHLRPRYHDLVKPNAYLNEISIGKWKQLFQQHCPEVEFQYEQDERETLIVELRDIRKQGELTEYTDEELLTTSIIALWKKPACNHKMP